MPRHKVRFHAPAFELGGKDLTLEIDVDEERLGRLCISEGGVDWWPKHSKVPRRMTWSQFKDRMES